MLKENIGIVLALVSLVVIAFIRRVDGFSQPKIVQHSDNDVYLNYGMPLILFCTATGFPLPLITWYHKGQKQESGNKIVIEAINQTSRKVKSIFTISNVMYLSKSGNPSYRCEAENRNGSTDPIIIKVFVNGKPIAPIQYESIAINSTSILVSWKAVETSKSPILVYTLYYNTDQTKTPKVNISATQSANYSLVVTGLEQLTTYLTYITASNSYGEGEASEKKISKTLAADPQPPKISLYNKKKITHHELTLKFVPSQQNKGDILAYQIFVEIIQDKPKSSPITLPAIYGNHSLNKSKGQLYMAADFKKQLPHLFTLGDGRWYGFHYNTRLLPLTKYRIYVRALARSTIDEKKIIYGKAETLELSTSFPAVPKIVLMKASTESLEISWHKSQSDMIYYKLLMKQGDNIVLDKRIDKVPYTLQGLEAGKVYMAYLTVCSKNHCTPSAEGTELKTIDSSLNISQSKSPESSMQLLVIVIAVGIAVLLLLVVIAVVYFVRRRKRQKQGFQEKDKANGETVPQMTKKGSTRSLDEDEIGLMENKDGMQLSDIELKPIRAKPTFADGESSTDAKTDWECSKGFVKVIKDIERDNFGKICKGSVKQFRDVSNASVMMRILKDNPSESTKADFLSVIETMKRLPVHNGVANLLGCITKQDPLTMILEYVPYGDLLGYLRTSRGLHDEHYKSEKSPINDLNSAELMSFAEQIAAAMAHLEQYKVIHGDLSARNVLVDRKGLCKLTKFGENPLVFDKDTYATKRKGRLLIKWAAIEVLFNKIHTIESDVWSFGILLYEIATVGGCPYIGKDDKWLMDMLKDDYRLPCPEHVSEALYSVMLDCWQNDPNERPNFEKLVKVMRTLTLMNKHQDHINMTKYDGQLYSKLDDS